jgi:fused signal recognition particle receptor
VVTEEPPAARAAALVEPEPAGAEDLEVEAARQTAIAVERTRRSWFGRIATIFERSQIDDTLWEELEELLIAADVGVETTEEVIAYVKDVVRKEGLKQPEEAREVLKDELEDILLSVDDKGALWGSGGQAVAPPAVILVVGVNGVGKTTSIAKTASVCSWRRPTRSARRRSISSSCGASGLAWT